MRKIFGCRGVNMCISISICIYIYIHIHMYPHKYVYIYTYIHPSIHTYLYIHTYIYIYIYIYIYTYFRRYLSECFLNLLGSVEIIEARRVPAPRTPKFRRRGSWLPRRQVFGRKIAIFWGNVTVKIFDS